MTRPQKVVLSSTCSVYGLSENIPFKEDEPTDCLNPYSLTKNHGEELFLMYHKLYNVESLVLRYFNVFGPRAPKTGSYAPVVSKFMDQVAIGKRPTIYGGGTNTRDYVHVEDVVNANLLAANSGLCLSGEIFNVGTGKDYSVLEIADMVRGDLEPEFLAPKQGECAKVVADASKIKEKLGWKPKHDLKSYVKKELKSLTKQKS
jgi:UDP-glucose 4-epimerase